MPNVIMLLGNHEYMMLQYLSPDATGTEIRRWNRNGNAPTLAAYLKQKAKVQQRIKTYLRTRPTHLELEVNGNRFYMVLSTSIHSLVRYIVLRCKQYIAVRYKSQ